MNFLLLQLKPDTGVKQRQFNEQRQKNQGGKHMPARYAHEGIHDVSSEGENDFLHVVFLFLNLNIIPNSDLFINRLDLDASLNRWR